jgi:HicA toxin of bacterial toxin-antitoxin,
MGGNEAPRPHRRASAAGLHGPTAGGKHEFMTKGDLVLTIPNPHGRDIGVGLLAVILRQAGVSRKQWESV